MNIRDEMKAYYLTMRDEKKNENYKRVSKKVSDELERFRGENPTASALVEKCRLHEAIAAHFEPVLFKGSPFFYEMGTRPSASWGFGGIAAMYRDSKIKEALGNREYADAKARFDLFCAQIGQDISTHIGLYRMPTPGFDVDHNSIGYREIFSLGIDGIIEKINKKLKGTRVDETQYEFCVCARRSLYALLQIAEKFAHRAEEMLPECENEAQRKYMRMIADAARRVPKHPPKSFYEGLATIWFMREAVGSLENIGVSVLGQVDMLLGPLYESDIQSGALTEDAARELLYLWMLPSDIKFFADENAWPETSTCLALGGCGGDGIPVFNDVTRMIIEIHSEHHLLAPKLNLRYGKNSPDAYIDLISHHALRGHNSFALSYDDVVIPSLVRGGVDEQDARAYLNGGCQETMVEGKGHTAGAYLYVLLPAILDLSLNECPLENVMANEDARRRLPSLITEADSYESFYATVLENIKKIVENACADQVVLGKRQPQINPCPLFSALHEGCIEHGQDYTEGGAKYNLSTVCLCGIATLVDSLYSIKKTVFENKSVSLRELERALLNNWKGYEELRTECIHLPKYGHGNREVDEIAQRVIADINAFVVKIENERGGKTILSTFSYYLFKTFAPYVRATPDGRRCADYLSQGISASTLGKTKNALEILDTIRTVGYQELSGISVVDLLLNNSIRPEQLSALIRAFGQSGCANLQLNILSKDKLLAAMQSPKDYASLIVRVSGLSVYFVNLNKTVQEEILQRNFGSAE